MVQDLLVKLGGSCFGLLFVGIGGYIMNNGRKIRAQSARIRDTETTHISGLQPGTVEVKGTARLTEGATVIESPIEMKDVLAAHVKVEQWEGGGEAGGSWTTIHEEETGVPMTVDDGTGEIRVELPVDGELNVEQTQTKVDSGDDPPERIQRYVENEASIDEATRHQYGPLSTGDRRRYSEGVIEPGEDVYVLGTAREGQGDWGERNYVIDEPTETGDFILSDKSKEQLVQEGRQGGLGQLAFGGIIALVGTLFTVLFWMGV